MTRFIHDQFAKQYLIELLIRFGQVEASKDISSEVRQIDIFFIPSPQATNNLNSLGLLGRIASTPVIIEPFRNPVTSTGILTCLGKLISIREQVARQSHQNNQPTNPSPKLWILSPTISPELLASCQATADESQWLKGIYFLPEIFKTAIVAIHQLPRTPETLWLRILGRGRVQQQAIRELETLPENNPWRESTIELVCNLLAILELRQRQQEELDAEEQELVMQLSPIYLQRLEEATQQGIEQGIERGAERERRNTVETLMLMRFGEIDAQLATIISSLIALSPSEFTPLLMELSRQELLARFGII